MHSLQTLFPHNEQYFRVNLFIVITQIVQFSYFIFTNLFEKLKFLAII